MDINLGEKFEKTFLVSEDIYQGFISIFKDKNPLHTDEEFAKIRGFKGRVMHGNILNGFISFFIGECLPTKNVIIHSQDIQFKNPVYLNDHVDFEAVVTGVYESVNALEFKFTFRNSDALLLAKGKIQIGILS
ncbi:MAG: MaoC/PaaZ C-terminal domain-containing protein [Bacteroidota bacterium]